MAPLDRALPLPKGDDGAMMIGDDLNLNVAHRFQELLQIESAVTKGGYGLSAGHLQGARQLLCPVDGANTLAAPASRRLDEEWVADASGGGGRSAGSSELLGAGNHGDPRFLHQAASLDLVPHQAHGLRRRAHKGYPVLPASLGEVRILGEEAVSRVDGVDTGLLGHLQDLRAVEVAAGLGRRGADEVGLVGKAHMAGVAIHIGVDRHPDDTHLHAGAQHPQGDLASISHQQLLEHLNPSLEVLYSSYK